MPIDPAGTKPGLTAVAEPPKQFHLKCKRAGCTSILATELTAPNAQGRHLYRCVQCNMTWGLSTGGVFEM